MQRREFSTEFTGAVALPFGNIAAGDGQYFPADVALTGGYVRQFLGAVKANVKYGFMVNLFVTTTVSGTLFVRADAPASTPYTTIGIFGSVAGVGSGPQASALAVTAGSTQMVIACGTITTNLDDFLNIYTALTVGSGTIRQGSALYVWPLR